MFENAEVIKEMQEATRREWATSFSLGCTRSNARAALRHLRRGNVEAAIASLERATASTFGETITEH